MDTERAFNTTGIKSEFSNDAPGDTGIILITE